MCALGASWAVFGVFSNPCELTEFDVNSHGVPLGLLEEFCGVFGDVLGRLGGVFGASWSVLCVVLDASWAVFAVFSNTMRID